MSRRPRTCGQWFPRAFKWSRSSWSTSDLTSKSRLRRHEQTHGLLSAALSHDWAVGVGWFTRRSASPELVRFHLGISALLVDPNFLLAVATRWARWLRDVASWFNSNIKLPRSEAPLGYLFSRFFPILPLDFPPTGWWRLALTGEILRPAGWRLVDTTRVRPLLWQGPARIIQLPGKNIERGGFQNEV